MSSRAALVLAIAACAPHVPRDEAQRFLGDSTFRRGELAASLVEPGNAYSRARLDRYAAWERLPEWNPRTAPLTTRGGDGELAALAISPAAAAGDRDALVELGAAAFFRYPVQTLAGSGVAIATDADLARYGLWRDGERAGGLVRAAMADGSTPLAYTCATCHADVRDGRVVVGLGNDALDVGRLVADAGHVDDPVVLAWGPGRADVSTARGDQPVRIPDLRPTRYLTHLQVNATVAQRDLASLALRIETLIVTANGEVVRPPREIVLGIALYVWSLAPAGPAREPATVGERHGRALFAARCATCHAPPGFTGPPVAIERVGVDAVARSRERGTGTWRVPSLLGIRDRRAMFHDGALGSLAAVLDPRRLAPDYTGGRTPGAVAEHRFGLELDGDARADLIAYLETL